MRLEKTSEYAREEAKSIYIQIYIKIDECLGGGKEKVRKKLKTRVNKITRHRSPAAAPNFDVRLSGESK